MDENTRKQLHARLEQIRAETVGYIGQGLVFSGVAQAGAALEIDKLNEEAERIRGLLEADNCDE